MKKELILSDQNSSLRIRKQCELISISRSSFYYTTLGEKPENLQIMGIMDKHILEEPTAGVLTMQSMLRDLGIKAGYERVRRLMRKAKIRSIYPRGHLRVLGEKKYIYPYLLQGLQKNIWLFERRKK